MEPAHEIPSLELLLAQEGWVRALARKLVGRESEAEDVAQSALAVALEHPPRSGESVPVLRAWLGQVARRLVIGGHRTDSRRLERERRAARAEALPSASEIHAQEEERRIVVETLLALGEPFRTTLLLRYYRGLEPIEIARAMDVPDSTVRNRLARGLAQLKQKLEARQGSDWRTSCALLAGPLAPASKGVLLGKGVVMGVNLKVAISCSVVALAGLAWWGLRDRAVERPNPAQLEVASVPKLSSETDKLAEEVSKSSALRAKVEQDPTAAGATQAASTNDPVGILVYGTVTQRGEPLPGRGAELRMLSEQGVDLYAESQSSGAFAIPGLSPGRWELTAQHAMHLPMKLTLLLDTAQPVKRVDLSFEPRIAIPVRFETPSGERLAQVLPRSPSGIRTLRIAAVATRERPPKRLPVSLRLFPGAFDAGQWMESSHDESANMDGTLLLDASPPLFVSAVARAQILEVQRVESLPREIVFHVRPEEFLSLEGGLRVRLVDTERHAAIDNVYPTLYYHDTTVSCSATRTGDELRLDELSPGRMELEFGAEGYASLRLAVEIPPGEVVDLGVREMQRTRRVSGVVVDEDGAPVTFPLACTACEAEPVQFLYSRETRITLKADGSFSAGLAPGRQRLQVLSENLVSEPLVVDGGLDCSGLRLVARHATPVSIVVDSGRDVDSALRLYDERGGFVRGWEANCDDILKLGLLPGHYRVDLVGLGGKLATREFEVGGERCVVRIGG
jgi:RNA polymerase sigma-70 factor (ECF subfamily)